MAEGFLPPVVVHLLADIKEFQAKMGEAKGEMDTLSAKGAATSKIMGTAFLGVAGAVGGLALGIGGVSVSLAEKFQTAMTKTSGQLGLTTDQTKRLSDQFSKMALGSEYSSTELANAYAGVAGQVRNLAGGSDVGASSTDILKASMELATAKGIDLNSAVSNVVGTMRTFQMPTKDAADAMAILYNTSSATGLSVDTLTATMGRMNAAVVGVKPPASDLAGLLVDLGQHGVTGSKAVARVSNSNAKMLNPAFQAKAAAAGLNLQLYDTNGQFVGMRNVIAQLQPQLAGMNTQQQIATLSTAGLGSAAEKLLPTINAGTSAFDKATSAVKDHKKATDAAEGASKTFHGRLKTLQSAATTLGTDLGNQLLGPVTNLVNYLDTKGIKAIDEFRAGFDGKKVNGFAAALGGVTKQVADFLAATATGKAPASQKPGARPSAGSELGSITRGVLKMGGNAGIAALNLGRAAWDVVNPFGASWWSGQRWSTVGKDFGRAGAAGGAFNRAFSGMDLTKPLKIAPGPIGPMHGDVGIKGEAGAHLTAMDTTSSTHLPKIANMSDFTSQHTRESNRHLMAINNAVRKTDKVNIKVKLV